MPRLVGHQTAVMTSSDNIFVKLGHTFKIDSVIRFVIQKATVILEPAVRRERDKFMALFKISHIP